MPQWWFRFRFAIRSMLFPLICIQFVRTLIIPNPLDVFILFIMFMAYVGFVFNWY